MWKNINININNVDAESLSSTLIKMPNKSRFVGYKFWHPNKLVRYNDNETFISIGYNDEFTFKLKKFGKKNKFKVIDEIEIDVDEFEEAFDCMKDCTRRKEHNSYLIIEEPTKIDMKIEIEECLKNN